MTVHIQKWGNSLAFRIPRGVADDLELKVGTEIELQQKDGTLQLIPVRRTEYSIDELVAQITPENRHAEIATGKPKGNEVW